MANCKVIQAVSNPMIVIIDEVQWFSPTAANSNIKVKITVSGTVPAVMTLTVDGSTDMTPTIQNTGTWWITTLYQHATNISHTVCVSP